MIRNRPPLPLTLAAACLLGLAGSAAAQFQPGQPGFPNNPPVTFNPPPQVAAAATGVSTGMMIFGIFLILVGLSMVAGVIFLALQGQKPSYYGPRRRR